VQSVGWSYVSLHVAATSFAPPSLPPSPPVRAERSPVCSLPLLWRQPARMPDASLAARTPLVVLNARCTASARRGRRLRAPAVAGDGELRPTHALSRRCALASVLLLTAGGAAAEQVAPEVGACTDCIGELDGALNACPLNAVSCVSVYSDDEEHFTAPWVIPGAREAALEELVRVAVGGEYDGGWSSAPFGRDRGDVARFILDTTAAFVARRPLPAKPGPVRATAEEKRAFDGRVEARTEGYLRVVFGEGQKGGGAVLDAEFLFLPGDEICNVRFASRSLRGEGERARLELSYSSGLVVDRNGARALAEDLRKALRWELAPVMASFDSQFNGSKQLWFERPFNALRAARQGDARRAAQLLTDDIQYETT